MGVFPSGQWGQTVNLLLFSFGGSNPPAPTKNSSLVKMLEFLFCRNFSKHIQGWIRTASTRRIVRRGKRPLRGLFRCAACESTRAHEKTAGAEIHWRFSFAQMSDSHRRVDENSGEPTATTTSAASGGSSEELLGPRPAIRKQGAAYAGCRNPSACGGNREARLGQRSDFSRPRQGVAEKSASATRKARRAKRGCCKMA